jgi:YidC/Oxa1 family membrane protein insertase
MDKKTVIALLLVGLVLLVWPLYMKKVVGIKTSAPVSVDSTGVRKSEAVAQPDKPVQEQVLSTVPQKQTGTTVTARPETLLFVNTDLFRGYLSSLGGGTLVNWELDESRLKDKSAQGKPPVWIKLVPDSVQGNLAVVPLADASALQVNHRLVKDSTWEQGGKKHRLVRFAHAFNKKESIEKEFVFIDGSFTFDMRVRMVGEGNQSVWREGYQVQWMSGFLPTENNVKDENTYYQAFALQGGELVKAKANGTGSWEGVTQWMALRSKYFLMAMVPRKPQSRAVEMVETKDKIGSANWKSFDLRLVMPYEGLKGETGEFTVYLGPMDYQELRRIGFGLDKLMNFGMIIIKPFSIAFLYTLQFIYHLIHSYGWAIVIFSILIKIALYPLTKKSLQSMRDMQSLQPKIAALKEKFKDDSQKLNQETMRMYKQHGVNPLGGCLPFILQMPILFALFNLFRTTIMLRKASYLGIIKDLSAPDEIIRFGTTGVNILPVLMGVTMIIQQRMTPQDPKQKMMAYFMPVFMIFIFYNLSAGLNLYYLIFNILSIAQDMYIKRKK